jgi:tRNA pseudouridine38-40 synthase
MRNIRLTIEFDGSGFFGWQFQPNRPTIQAALQSAVDNVTKEKTVVYGCSRTDSGVSARNYAANFHTGSRLPLERFPVALSANLPESILVKTAGVVGPQFHARHSARGKTYEYLVVMGRSPLRRARAWELYRPADPKRMARALRLFPGERDFRAFCHMTNLPSGLCRITSARLESRTDEIRFSITGDRFLYKMVRRIVGAAVTYGAGGITLADIRAALAGREHRPFQTAPAQGLVLESVAYQQPARTPALSYRSRTA